MTTSRVMAWCGVGVGVTGDAALLDQLEQQLPPFFEGSGDVVAAATLTLSGGQLSVELPDGLSVTGSAYTETLRAAASRIELLIAAQLPDRVAVHAGAVAWNGRAIIIAGPSRSGKSTLVRALVDAGATYLSDEFALLDAEGCVWPYPRRMTMRTANGTERRVPTLSADPTGPAVPVALLANLAFSSAGWVVEPSTQGQSVLALAANCLAIRRAPARTLESLTAAAQAATGLRGSRGEAASAASSLLGLV